MVLDTSLKIWSFLTFQITQHTARQIILKPFWIFLWIDPPLQHSWWISKLGGITKIISNHHIKCNQVFFAISQCKKRWVEVSLSLSQQTQIMHSPKGKMFLIAKFSLFRVRSSRSSQKNATTFDGASNFQIWQNTLLSSSGWTPSPPHPFKLVVQWLNRKTPIIL